MGRRKTHGEYVEDVRKLYPDGEYIIIGEYIDSKTPIMVRHEKCGNEYSIKPSLLLTGITCTKCNIKSTTRNRKTQDQFDKEVYSLYGEEYTFLGSYINARTKLMCRHNICGHEWMVIHNHF